jgi:hypothetical protein
LALALVDSVIVVYGASVVAADHYVLRIHRDDPQAQAIEDRRDDLTRIAAEDPTAMIDHCEHFYRCSRTPPELETDVDDVVRWLNDRVVSASPDVVMRAKERILVAGGQDKIAALVELTNHEWSGPRPTTLITDSQTAQVLPRDHRS